MSAELAKSYGAVAIGALCASLYVSVFSQLCGIHTSAGSRALLPSRPFSTINSTPQISSESNFLSVILVAIYFSFPDTYVPYRFLSYGTCPIVRTFSFSGLRFQVSGYMPHDLYLDLYLGLLHQPLWRY